MNDLTVNKTMDLKGLPCPMPVVKVSKGIKDINVGEILEKTEPSTIIHILNKDRPYIWLDLKSFTQGHRTGIVSRTPPKGAGALFQGAFDRFFER